MPDLKTLGAVIGWVGGSMAGITALLYAIGFVATLYHLNQMGINTELVSRDGFVYVGRGAIALNNAFLFIFIGAAFAGAIVWTIDRTLGVLAWATDALRRRLAHKPFSLDAMVSAAILLLVAVSLVVFAFSNFIGKPITSPGLLFSGRICDDGGVRRICDPHVAERTFGWVSVFAGASLVVSWVGASRVAGDGLLRRAALTGYAITALVVVFFMIPVAYGTMIIREEMPQVTLRPDDAQHLGLEGRSLQLLRQDASGTLLWMRATRELQWVAPGELKTLRLARATAAAPAPPGPPVAPPGGVRP